MYTCKETENRGLSMLVRTFLLFKFYIRRILNTLKNKMIWTWKLSFWLSVTISLIKTKSAHIQSMLSEEKGDLCLINSSFYIIIHILYTNK